jgi:hypothetical protein
MSASALTALCAEVGPVPGAMPATLQLRVQRKGR